MIRGDTQLLAIVGSPVAQVKSPVNFNEHFDRAGENVAMIAMDVRPSAVEALVETIRGWENLIGCVVTIPHKQAFASKVDFLSDRARALGAVNVVRRDGGGTLSGDMVDGFGFLGAARKHGFLPEGRRALVVGAGGAGSAICYALCEAGVAELAIFDTAEDRRARLASFLADKFPGTNIVENRESLSSLDLLANATPVGMAANPGLPLPDELLETLSTATLVADVVTSPPMTPLLLLATRKGCRVQTGPEMAIAQLDYLGAALGVMAAPRDYVPMPRDQRTV
jgi:shikimate dehydrogenase